MNNSMFNDFYGFAQIPKTLRFSLKPIGNTLTKYLESDFLDNDLKRSQDYVKLKELMDSFYSYEIDKRLSQINLDWTSLAEAYRQQDKDITSKTQNEYRAKVDKLFDSKKSFFNKSVLDRLIPDYIEETYGNDEKQIHLDTLETFKQFSTVLTGFWENRKNIFTDEAISTAIPYRLVHENFPLFLDNCNIFVKQKDKMTALIEEMNAQFKAHAIFSSDDTIDSFFEISSFNRLCKQEGIELYNTILGGFTLPNDIKIQGYNEHVNLLNQQAKSDGSIFHFTRMNRLKKQILSKSDTTSFVLDQIDVDAAVIEKLRSIHEMATGTDKDHDSIFSTIENLYKMIADNQHGILIDSKHINQISNLLYGEWHRLNEGIKQLYDNQKSTMDDKSKKRFSTYLKIISDEEQQAASSKKGRPYFSVVEINQAISLLNVAEIEKASISQITSVFEVDPSPHKDLVEKETYLFEQVIHISEVSDSVRFNDNSQLIESIKEYLDFFLKLKSIWKMIDAYPYSERNLDFYINYQEAGSFFDPVITTYNQIRNYLTKKTDNTQKIVLHFDKPTLLNGWSESKIGDYRSVLLRDDKNYYLAILRETKYKKIFNAPINDEDKWEKLNYMQFKSTTGIPKGSIMLKAVREHFRNNNRIDDYIIKPNGSFIKQFHITREIVELYTPVFGEIKKFQKEYFNRTKDEIGHRKALKKWIDFCKEFLYAYKNTHQCDFRDLRKSDEYEDLNEFYKDVDSLSYRMEFESISKEKIFKAVDNDLVFLFQIYNKDFSVHAKGKPNLHTMIWRSLFSNENLAELNLKLQGGAKIFYRQKQISPKTVHEKGSILLNKIMDSGLPVPTKIYKEVHQYLNGQIDRVELSEDAKELLDSGKLTSKEADRTIVKDRRYTENMFLFHVPVLLNCKQSAWSNVGRRNLNKRVLEVIRNRDDVRIIGIDRGERNLIYISVIDQEGRILEQYDLNRIVMSSDEHVRIVDYHALLDQRERDRDDARKNWQAIEKIKELKQGYISQVVHFISNLLIKHNAILVMEDLNFGFKRGRFKVEKQVYQNFEMALITKLNNLIFKDFDINDPGGVLKPLQLTYSIEKLADLRNQCGIVFYVPAAYTSKVDPATGFIDLFRWNELSSNKKIRKFLQCFEEISFDSATKMFKFRFNYINFGSFCRVEKPVDREWTACSEGFRSQYIQKNKQSRVVNLTTELISLSEDMKIDLSQSDLKNQLTLETVTGNNLRSWKDLLRLVFQMRNNIGDGDHIYSPIMDDNGVCFTTAGAKQKSLSLPIDADANGAYHIALKGKMIIRRNNDSVDLKESLFRIKQDDWFNEIMIKNDESPGC